MNDPCELPKIFIYSMKDTLNLDQACCTRVRGHMSSAMSCDIVRLCLKYGADVNSVDCVGQTPLFYAVTHWQSSQLVPILLNAGEVFEWHWKHNLKQPFTPRCQDQPAKMDWQVDSAAPSGDDRKYWPGQVTAGGWSWHQDTRCGQSHSSWCGCQIPLLWYCSTVSEFSN